MYFMKNLSLVLNVVLVIAVIVLFVLHFKGEENQVNTPEVGKTVVTKGKIAYINVDTLLANYLQSKELNEAYLKKVEEKRTELNVKARQFAKENEEFQQKWNNNGFLTRERANEAYAELAIKNENLQRLQQEIQENLAREQHEIRIKLLDVFNRFFQSYNKTKGYDMVLSTTLGGNVFYAQPQCDITQEVLKLLNEQYIQKK